MDDKELLSSLENNSISLGDDDNGGFMFESNKDKQFLLAKGLHSFFYSLHFDDIFVSK